MFSFVLLSFADCSALLAFVVELQCSCTFAAAGFVTSLLYFSTIATLSDTGDVYFNHNLHLSRNIPLVSITAMWSCLLICFITSIFSLEASLNKGVHTSGLHTNKLFIWNQIAAVRRTADLFIYLTHKRLSTNSLFMLKLWETMFLIAFRYDWIKWRLQSIEA